MSLVLFNIPIQLALCSQLPIVVYRTIAVFIDAYYTSASCIHRQTDRILEAAAAAVSPMINRKPSEDISAQ